MKSIALISLSLLFMTACSNDSDSNNSAGETTPVATPVAGSDVQATIPPAETVQTPPAPSDGSVVVPEAPVSSETSVVPVVPEAPALAEVLAFQVDATNKVEWAHLDLDTGKVVAATDASWDLAFKRTAIKMNSDVSALVLNDTSFDAITKAPEGEYAADAPVAGGLETDGLFFHTPSAWYAYNMETHVISSRNYTYIVRSNAGNDIKLALTDYYDLDRLPAFIQIETQILGASN